VLCYAGSYSRLYRSFCGERWSRHRRRPIRKHQVCSTSTLFLFSPIASAVGRHPCIVGRISIPPATSCQQRLILFLPSIPTAFLVKRPPDSLPTSSLFHISIRCAELAFIACWSLVRTFPPDPLAPAAIPFFRPRSALDSPFVFSAFSGCVHFGPGAFYSSEPIRTGPFTPLFFVATTYAKFPNEIRSEFSG